MSNEITMTTVVTRNFKGGLGEADWSTTYTRAAVVSELSFRVQLGGSHGWADGVYNRDQLVGIGVADADICKLEEIFQAIKH